MNKFPKNFYFGAATASHQVEGNNLNDWTEWEKINADRLAKRSGDKPSDHVSGQATNHYELFEKDLDLMKSLGLNAYRFSIEWSRIEPQKGQFNQKEIEHYQKVVKACRERRIEPFITLWHWTIPLWLRDEGGWENKKIIGYFTNYAKKIVENLPEVKFWITLNEPGVYVNKSYRQGDWPPQKRNIFTYFKVLNILASAHSRAYQVIKKINPNSQIGIAHHLTDIGGFRPLAKTASWWANDHFINKIGSYQDFIGVNYYFHVRLLQPRLNEKVSDMGWGLHPDGLYNVTKGLAKFNKPIYITEHGLADAKDLNRGWYIEESLKYLEKAISEGADIRGYLHWSLLDNFEWWDGFWPRFGLIEVDYANDFKRTVRPSAYKYAELIKKYRID